MTWPYCTQTRNGKKWGRPERRHLAIKGYLKSWCLKLNVAKTTAFAFHLNNKEADCDLDVWMDGKALPHSKYPVYLGVQLDQSLTYRQHIEGLHCKVAARNCLLHCLAGTSWGASTSTLCTGDMGIVISAAEYACPVWYCGVHIQKLDMCLNETFRILSG